MSNTLPDLLAQAVTVARAQGLELADLGERLLDAWNDPPVETSEYVDGMSKPDDNGCVAFEAVEAWRAKLPRADQNIIFGRWCVTPALERVAADSAQAAIIRTTTSTTQFYEGMGMGGGWQVHPVKPNPDPQGPKWLTDRSVTISNAQGVPAKYTTIKQCVDYIIKYGEEQLVQKYKTAHGFGPK